MLRGWREKEGEGWNRALEIKRWREEISSVQFSGTPYRECGALHTSAHTHSAEEEEEERASRALSLVRALRANRIDHASAMFDGGH